MIRVELGCDQLGTAYTLYIHHGASDEFRVDRESTRYLVPLYPALRR